MEHNNTVKQAGGFILQLMPFTDEKIIDALEKKLAEITSVTSMLDAGMSPEQILEQILGDFGLEIKDTMPTRFFCNCSRGRVEKALISIGQQELKKMIADGKPVNLNCHFCNSDYEFGAEDLKRILKQSRS